MSLHLFSLISLKMYFFRENKWSDRPGNKTIELEIEANGKKLKVKASSRQ